MAHRTVFILGAGASREAGAPLMSEFVKLVREIGMQRIISGVVQPPAQVTVMTFNYELALDCAFHIDRVHTAYCLSPDESEGSISLLKLHGSLNWSRCKNPKCNVIS